MKSNLMRRLSRRRFLAASGVAVLGQVTPNLILSPAFGGTAVIIDSSGDKLVSLSNASFARPFDIGTWSVIRVGMMARMDFASSLTGLTPNLPLGLCSGSTNQVFDATTTNFIGVRSNSASWNLSAGSPDIIWVVTSGWLRSKRVGSTWTDGAGTTSGAPCFMRTSEADGACEMYMVEITKGSPNYSISIFCPTAANTGVTRDNFLAQLVAVTPALGSHTWYTSTPTLAFDQAAGALDHVQVGWSRSEATLEITDLALVKMAA